MGYESKFLTSQYLWGKFSDVSRFCCVFLLLILFVELKGQDSVPQVDTSVHIEAQNFVAKWRGHSLYRDSLANDSFFHKQLGQQSFYSPVWISNQQNLGNPIPRNYPSNTWRYLVLLVLMTCVGLARLVNPGVILTYFRSFLKPKLLSEVLEDQASEISGFSILMSLFTAMMYALPLQWLLSINDGSMTDYPFGDYLLLTLLLFSFVVLRFVLSSIMGRIFEARYFASTSIYASVFLNFFTAALSIAAFLVMLLNNWKLDFDSLRFILLLLLLMVTTVKILRTLTHAISSFSYPWFYLILYLCAFEIAPWTWVFILLESNLN